MKIIENKRLLCAYLALIIILTTAFAPVYAAETDADYSSFINSYFGLTELFVKDDDTIHYSVYYEGFPDNSMFFAVLYDEDGAVFAVNDDAYYSYFRAEPGKYSAKFFLWDSISCAPLCRPVEVENIVVGGISASCMITSPTSLYVGEDLQLYAESSDDVNWSVCNTDGSPTELAEIDKNGLLTAKGAGYVLVYAAGASCLSCVALHIRERAVKPDIGYVLNGAVLDSSFNNVPPQLQIINSASVTGIYDIDNSLYVENPSSAIREMAKESDSDYAVVEVSKLDDKQQQTLIDELVGQVVEFYASEGVISKIVLTSNDFAFIRVS